MSWILSLDTSGQTTFVTLYDELTSRTQSYSSAVSESHNEELAKTVFSLLQQEKIKAQVITKILIGIGPGSFTGLRIGAAFVSGLATALSIPVFTASSFAGKAFEAGTRLNKNHVAILLDATPEECFFGLYQIHPFSPLFEPQFVSRDFAQHKFATVDPESSHLLIQENDPSLGILSLFLEDPTRLKRWEPQAIGELELLYSRPVSAKTILERTSARG